MAKLIRHLRENLFQVLRKESLQLLNGVARDPAQDFAETVKRIDFIDLAGIQGKHISFQGAGASIQTRKTDTFYVPALSLA